MPCGASTCPDQPLVIDGQAVEFVDSFIYLGSQLSADGRCASEVDRRLAAAARAFGALQCVFRDKNISVRTKRVIYSACVLAALLYGAECWPILRRDENRLDAFHHRCLRAILGVSRLDQQLHHITNNELRCRWGDPGMISDVLRQRRLQWLGHVARMQDERLPKQILFGWLPHTRPAHGPRLRWKDRVAADLKKLDVTKWYEIAQKRDAWRSITRTMTSSSGNHPSVLCQVCQRSFKSQAGFTRHKCVAERQLQVKDQPGARQCLNCLRWFKSAGGLAVHKCRSLDSTASAQSPTSRSPVSASCCSFHCGTCTRCFKSGAGFQRHNCHRGQRPHSSQRDGFLHTCSSCSRKFRRPSDLKRHKCYKN